MVLRPENFTEQAREVLAASQQIVRRYRHAQWDAEHILLALLEQEGGVPVQILTDLGVQLEALKGRLEEALAQAPQVAHESSQIYATPRAQRLMENAAAEVQRLKDEFIGTEHLLIAATLERHGDIARILA